jgi:hypothetical protein
MDARFTCTTILPHGAGCRTRLIRYSLIGREVTNDALCEHLKATGLAGTIAVVACDKLPVGTLAALLEQDWSRLPAQFLDHTDIGMAGDLIGTHDIECFASRGVLARVDRADMMIEGRLCKHVRRFLPGRRTHVTLRDGPCAARRFYRAACLERRFRDIQAARYHPLQAGPQARYAGALALGLPVDRIF